MIDVFEKKIKNVPFTEFYDQFPQQHAHDSNRVKDTKTGSHYRLIYIHINGKKNV